MASDSTKVRFIRVNGRVVPVRAKKGVPKGQGKPAGAAAKGAVAGSLLAASAFQVGEFAKYGTQLVSLENARRMGMKTVGKAQSPEIPNPKILKFAAAGAVIGAGLGAFRSRSDGK